MFEIELTDLHTAKGVLISAITDAGHYVFKCGSPDELGFSLAGSIITDLKINFERMSATLTMLTRHPRTDEVITRYI